MLNNYLKIAIRNFLKERFYASINILGLALGISSSLLITIYVVHELSYDDFHPDVENTYRVNMTNIWYPENGTMSSTVLPLAQVLADNYPEIVSSTRINTAGNNLVRYDNGGQPITFFEDQMLAADSNFFEFFGFELKEGDPSTALKGLNKVVISEETAVRYFGNQPALGKILLFGESKKPIEVSGVTYKQPTNSHFHFDFLLSMYTNPSIKRMEWSWIFTQVVTYVKTLPKTDINKLQASFEPIARKHATPALQRLDMDLDEFEAEKGKWIFELEHIRDIHLNKLNAGNRIGTVSDESYIYIFSSVAILVIVLAMINFMNLSTARASARAKEVGVRKVMGSLRKQLILQILIESVFMSTAATLVGLGLMELMKMGIQDLVNVEFHISIWDYTWLIAMVVILPFVMGLLAGVYPAFYLTRYEPAKVLKGELKSGSKSAGMRNILVFLQFTISITLLASTMIVYDQLNYVNNKDLGFDRENIIVVNWADKLGTSLESFRNELLERTDVKTASISMDMIGRGTYEDVFRKERSNAEITLATLKVDENFFSTMGLKIKEGRTFRKESKSDRKAVIINESAIESLDLEEGHVIGSKIYYFNTELEIIGIAKNFNYHSLRLEVAPFIFMNIDAPIWGDSRVVAIKVEGNETANLIADLEESWKSLTDVPFQYSLYNKEFENTYRSEQQLAGLFAIFTVFAMIIASLGLFGLASYTVSQRRKEIGIRKVLGASSHRLVLMLNGNYSKIILVAILVSIPLSWWGMTQWLAQFAYKVDVGWQIYVITGLGSLFLAWCTVGFQSLKATLINPVDSLRDE